MEAPNQTENISIKYYLSRSWVVIATLLFTYI